MLSAVSAETARYTRVAVALHWLIAAFIFYQIVIGFLAGSALGSDDAETRRWASEQIQIHKSVGLTVLGLTVIRIAWRILHPAPPLPASMGPLERAGAAVSHVLFYGAMLALPLTGWAMVSSSVEFGSLKTFYFGLFAVPHLPGLVDLPDETKRAVSGAFKNAHWTLAMGTVLMLLVHVGAALKHHLVDRDAVLARMVPGVSPRNGRALSAPGANYGFGRIAAAAALVGLAGAATAALYIGEERKAAASAEAPAAVAASDPEAAADPTLWRPIAEESAIAFSGENSGAAFEGAFKAWSAEIRFDPDALDQASARVTVDVASARTGDAQIDATLPEKDWFDAGAHPQAVFEADRFTRAEGENAYRAEGRLTLRGETKPVALPFTVRIDGDRAEMSGATTLNRLDWGVGAAADASGSWVSLEIPLSITVVAVRGGSDG